MARKFFCAYHSFLQSMEPLNDAERGRLFVACLEYSMSGVEPELRGNERFVFPTIKSQIDRDKNKYNKQCRQNQDNINKRWRNENKDTTVYDYIQPNTDTTVYDRIQPNTDGYETYQGEREREEEREKRHGDLQSPNVLSEFFEVLWSMYPKKKGKAKVSKAQKEKLYKIGHDELSRCIERYKLHIAENRYEDKYIMHGSSFFNKGYEDYLDENNQAPESQSLIDWIEAEGGSY